MEVGDDVRGFFKCYVFGFPLICNTGRIGHHLYIVQSLCLLSPCHLQDKGKKCGVGIYQIMPKDSQSILNTFFR